MIDGMQSLLLQILIVLFPALVLQEYWMRKHIRINVRNASWKAVFLLCSVSVIICTTFPVETVNGHMLDLRMIPVIIAFVYGGMLSGMMTSGILVLDQLVLGEGDMLDLFLFLPLTVGVCVLFLYQHKTAGRRRINRYFVPLVSVAALLQASLCLIEMLERNTVEKGSLFLVISYPFISAFSMWMLVSFLENAKERILMEREIQKTERLNVIGHLAASVAHEVRNPMTVVRGFMQIFQNETYIPEAKKEYLKLMIRELDRAETIINDYLTLARPKLEQTETIRVRDQIHFVLDTVSSFALLHNIEIVKEVGRENMLVRGNREKLNQVLINLIKNAIEASPPGKNILISATCDDDVVSIKVQDWGKGMSREQISQLGTPFFSTKESGTGLGLTVSYHIVETMNGKIKVDSREGEGATFILELPRYDPEAHSETCAVKAIQRRAGRGP